MGRERGDENHFKLKVRSVMCLEGARISTVILLAGRDSVSAPLGSQFGGLVDKINQRLNIIHLMALIMS